MGLIGSKIIASSFLDALLLLRPDFVVMANVAGTVYENTALTNPVDQDGQQLAGWRDLTGNGRHLTQGTTNNQMIWSVGLFGSGGGETVTSTVQYEQASPVTPSGIVHGFCVASYAGDTTRRFLRGSSSGSGNRWSLRVSTTNSYLELANTTDGGVAVDNVAFTSGIIEYQIQSGANGYKLYVNNVLEAQGTGSVVPNTASDDFCHVATGSNWIGAVGGFAEWSRILTAAERATAYNYFLQRFPTP